MSTSRITGNGPTPDIDPALSIPAVVSSDQGRPAPIVLFPNLKDASIEERKFSHSVGLLAGLTVFVLAIIVVVVALTFLAPGVPQSIVLAMALSGVSLGGFSVMKHIVNKVQDLFIRDMSDKKRVKSALGVGLGFTGLGLAMKVGSSFIPGGYGSVMGKLSGSASSKGSSSLLTSLSHYIYLKFARSEKAAAGEPLTHAELLEEAKKLHYISLSLLCVGMGFAVLGIVLGVVGGVALSGVPAAALIVLAPPLISIGISSVLQTLLHSSIAKWKGFLDAQEKHALFTDMDLNNIRNEVLSARDLQKLVTEEESSPVTEIEGQQRISPKEVDRKLSLTKRQKLLLALCFLLLIAGVSAVVASGFGPMTVLQVCLVSSVGSSVASTVLPMVSSGVVYNIFQLKTRFRIAKARQRERVQKKLFIQQLTENKERVYTKEEIEAAWEEAGSSQVIADTEYSISKELADFERHRGVESMMVAGMFVACGIGIMLFSLIPVLTPIIPGILGIGSVLFSIGAGMYLKKLTAWLYANLVALRNRLYQRRARLNSIIQDLEDEESIVVPTVIEGSPFDDLAGNPGDDMDLSSN